MESEKPFPNSGVTRRLWTLGCLELTLVVIHIFSCILLCCNSADDVNVCDITMSHGSATLL